MQKGLVSEDTSPSAFVARKPVRIPAKKIPGPYKLSWRRDLNPRPSDYKSDALPAELRQRRPNRVRIAERARKLQGGGMNFEHVGGQVCGKTLSLCRTLSDPIFRFLCTLA